MTAKAFNAAPQLKDKELTVFRINLMEDLKQQADVGETYFCYQNGITYTAALKGPIPNFKAKKLGCE